MEIDKKIAYDYVLKNEREPAYGGWLCDKDDPGGETYNGISRASWALWEGWQIIDNIKKSFGSSDLQHNKDFQIQLDTNKSLQDYCFKFYDDNFMCKILADNFISKIDENYKQSVFILVLDTCVNIGLQTGLKIAESCSFVSPEIFIAEFLLSKIAYYIAVVKKHQKSEKFFYGWILRTLNEKKL
jgi:hypothetical protein